MKRVLLDTNVILDVLLDRQPHADASAKVWLAIESRIAEGMIAEGMIAAHAVTTIHYLIRKEKGNATAKRIVSAVLRVLTVARVDASTILQVVHVHG